MRSVTTFAGPYALTTMGGGTACALRHDVEGRSVFLQGDDAVQFLEELEQLEQTHERGAALGELWALYSDVSEED